MPSVPLAPMKWSCSNIFVLTHIVGRLRPATHMPATRGQPKTGAGLHPPTPPHPTWGVTPGSTLHTANSNQPVTRILPLPLQVPPPHGGGELAHLLPTTGSASGLSALLLVTGHARGSGATQTRRSVPLHNMLLGPGANM